jgi:hypothetical protein
LSHHTKTVCDISISASVHKPFNRVIGEPLGFWDQAVKKGQSHPRVWSPAIISVIVFIAISPFSVSKAE